MNTPETDAHLTYYSEPDDMRHHIDLCRKLERERDAALAREDAIIHFCEVELGWMFFRAEYRIGDNPTTSEINACKLREFLATLPARPVEKKKRL